MKTKQPTTSSKSSYKYTCQKASIKAATKAMRDKRKAKRTAWEVVA
jgi:hypothetical protein